jgi:hypothetical protein
MLVTFIEGVRLSNLASFKLFLAAVIHIVSLEIISELTAMTRLPLTEM